MAITAAPSNGYADAQQTLSALRLEVRDFGPLRHAQVELGPLTIFVGSNNTGKTMLAKLAYALSGALSPYWPQRPASGRFWAEMFRFEHQLEGVPLAQLPLGDQDRYQQAFAQYRTGVEARIGMAFPRYFGVADLAGLARATDKPVTPSVRLAATGSANLALELQSPSVGTPLAWSLPDFDQLSVLPKDAFPGAPGTDAQFLDLRVAQRLWTQLAQASGVPTGSLYYLPAGRSGLIAATQLITSTAINIIRQGAGVTPIEIAPFEGVNGDFIQDLVDLFATIPMPNGTSDATLVAASAFLDQHLLHGQLTIEAGFPNRPTLVYHAGPVHVPVTFASSMVSELAPVALWLQRYLKPGDWLYIDEPEAHLHPEHQREIARLIVLLVRAGVRVVCTTHSSLILHQLSNALLAAHLDSARRTALGLAEDEWLTPAETRVYLFAQPRDGAGTVVRPLAVDEENGIPEDEFVAVADAIGEETWWLAANEYQPT